MGEGAGQSASKESVGSRFLESPPGCWTAVQVRQGLFVPCGLARGHEGPCEPFELPKQRSELLPQRRSPVARSRRWVVVRRRPGAAAFVDGPFTLEKARTNAADTRWPDAAIAVYELVRVA